MKYSPKKGALNSRGSIVVTLLIAVVIIFAFMLTNGDSLYNKSVVEPTPVEGGSASSSAATTP